MDAPGWVADDDREFGPDPNDPSEGLCPDCGAYPSEPCELDCACAYCIHKRARASAVRTLDVLPEDAA